MASTRDEKRSKAPPRISSNSIQKDIEKLEKELAPLADRYAQLKSSLDIAWEIENNFLNRVSAKLFYAYKKSLPLLLSFGLYKIYEKSALILLPMLAMATYYTYAASNSFIEGQRLRQQSITEMELELNGLKSSMDPLNHKLDVLKEQLNHIQSLAKARQDTESLPAKVVTKQREKNASQQEFTSSPSIDFPTTFGLTNLPINIKNFLSDASDQIQAVLKIIREGLKQKNLEAAQVKKAKIQIKKGLTALEQAEESVENINQIGEFRRYRAKLQQLKKGLTHPQEFYNNKKWQWLFSGDTSEHRELQRNPITTALTAAKPSVREDAKSVPAVIAKAKKPTKQASTAASSVSSTQTTSSFFTPARAPSNESYLRQRIDASEAYIAERQRMLDEEAGFIDGETIQNEINILTSGLEGMREELRQCNSSSSLQMQY